ncbi:MAG: hypothetical protein V4615_13660 [Bacteroidota bacterium]
MAKVLIHIGYPKAGSTYLQEWYSRHPALHYKGKGVLGFDNNWDIATYAETTEKLHECFVLSSEDLSVWKGEMDMSTLDNKKDFDIRAYQEKLADTLFAVFPNAQILICTRGFESMLYAMYNQNVSIGGILRFKDFMAKLNVYLADFYDYSFVIQLYRERFGKNVLVLPVELLKDDSKKFVRLIEDAIELEHRYYLPAVVNASMNNSFIHTYLVFSKTLYSLLKLFPASFNQKVYQKYVRMLAKEKPHPFMKAMNRLINGETDLKVKPEDLNLFRDKAEILRNEPLYQPYLKDYLL